MTSSFFDALLSKQSEKQPEKQSKKPLKHAIALIKPAIHLIDTAVALNFVVAICFTSVGMFFDVAATGKINPVATISLFLLTWQIYIADRLVKNPEDIELEDIESEDSATHSATITQQHQTLIQVLAALSLIIQAICTAQQPHIIIGLLIGWLSGWGYIIKLPIIHRRIKQIPCAKTFYVPLVCIAMGLGTTGEWQWSMQHWDIAFALWMLVGTNTLVFDIKDCDRDFAAGIYTFFNLFPYNNVLHTAVCLSGAIALLIPILSLDPAHLALSAAAIGNILLLLPLYHTRSTRYITHIFEWNITLPLGFLAYLSA